MKVILSIDPIKYPLTGIGRYAFELATRLASSDRIEALRFIAGHRFVNSIPAPSASAPAMLGVRHQLLKSRLAVSAFQSVSSVLKRRALKGCERFIFHGPNFYLPAFAGQSVATFHDLSMYHWRHCHPKERIRFMEHEIALSLKRASMLITDSEYTRREVADFFAWPLEKIRAIPLASSAEFHPRDEVETNRLLTRLGLTTQGYTLFSGTIEPRKNLDTLLDAYANLPAAIRARWPLVLCGYSGWMSGQLHQRIERASAEGWVKYVGYLPAEELPLLFAGARLFAFPSLYEGFGLPVLEAMASGVPVVCSNAASLPEVAGSAAATCDALDADVLRSLLRRGLEDDDWRASAIAAGLARAAKFSWIDCAERTIDLYQQLHNNSA